ncbi:MAG: hypothetical protein WC641_05820 [Patescibacteria group bacterium]
MLQIARLQDLNGLLKWNRLYASGSHVGRVFLHAYVAAESQTPQDSLYGIYFALPECAWLAVWLAVMNREFARKSRLKFRYSKNGRDDCIGNLEIFTSDFSVIARSSNDEAISGLKELPPEAINGSVHLDLVDLESFPDLTLEDISWCDGNRQVTILRGLGFEPGTVEQHSERVFAWVTDREIPLLLKLDARRVVLVNVEQITPTVQVELLPSLIAELRKRMTLKGHEPPQDCIASSCAI